MSVWLALFVAVFGTIGFFVAFYGAVLTFTETRRAKARPRLGLTGGDKPGTLTFFVRWDPDLFSVQIYRLRFSLANPFGEPKEATFTVTYDPPQKAPFAQPVELPEEYKRLLSSPRTTDAILTVDFRTIENYSMANSFRLEKVRKVYAAQKREVPSDVVLLKPAGPDHPAVFSLDYEELVQRRKKLRELEAAAKAKAAKAPPPKPPTPTETKAPSAETPAKPASTSDAAPKTAVVPEAGASTPAPQLAAPPPTQASAPAPPPSSSPPPAALATKPLVNATPAAKPAAATPTTTSVPANVPSIKTVIAQSNAKKEPAPKATSKPAEKG